MAEIKVYGASDDLIEVEGPGGDEFGGGGDPRFLHFSEGTVLKVVYGDADDRGIWKIERVRAGSAACGIVVKEEEDDDGYSDIATLTGDVACVGCWSSAEGPTADDMAAKITSWAEDTSERRLRGVPVEKLLALWRAIEALS